MIADLRLGKALATLSLLLASVAAVAHSASDAYLTLTEAVQNGQPRPSVIHAQWDIALRDLDFVLKLDDDGDGNIDWGELRRHQAAIAHYAYTHLQLSGVGTACRLEPRSQMVDDHADGAYASLMFDLICFGVPKQLSLDYSLFFAIDPSHRAILVVHHGGNISTGLLSAEKPRLDLPL